MKANEHFRVATSWDEASDMLRFVPVAPTYTAGLDLDSLSVHVRSARGELAVEDRSLEAHYGSVVVSQAWKGPAEARRWAIEVRYGPEPEPVTVADRPGMAYGLGPEVPPDDIDGRAPAVVAWHDGDLFYLVASDTVDVATLLDIAASMYPSSRRAG